VNIKARDKVSEISLFVQLLEELNQKEKGNYNDSSMEKAS
jgi:hypothetical protein